MSRICQHCGKTPKKHALRSHALNKTLTRQLPNLQKVNGERICTKCRRTSLKHALEGKN